MVYSMLLHLYVHCTPWQRVQYSGGSRISRRGGVDLVGGAWTPEAAMFHKICMSKRKNWVP